MPTFMTKNTFGLLKKDRGEMLRKDFEPAGIFVPWSGADLERKGGLYFVGMALNGEECGVSEKQTFEACYKRTADTCRANRQDRKNTPFWRYLDDLTRQLFNGKYYETYNRWGWSNILKINGTSGSPKDKDWSLLIDSQRVSATIALKEEFSKLKKSLIVIASCCEFGILDDTIGSIGWNRCYEKSGYWWRHDALTGNVIVWGYHPHYALRAGFWGQQLKGTLKVARPYLQWVP